MFNKVSLTFLLFSSFLAAEAVSPAAEKAVTAAEKQWRQAVLENNQAVLKTLMAPDITYTHSSSLTQTREQFLESIAPTKYQGIDFKTSEMRQYGNTVIVIHEALITSGQTGTSHLYLTQVWARQKGHWQMVSRQATKIPEASK